MNYTWYANYDSLIARVCPDYEKGLDAVVDGISEAKRILELGCGTGNLTERLAKAYPDAEIIGIDKDENMLQKARAKLKQYPNIELIKGVIPHVEVKGFDTVVSSLVFHLLPEEYRLQLLKAICCSDTQIFAMFDRVKGETEEEERKYFDYFKRNLQGLPGEIIQRLLEESRTNYPMKLSEHRQICEGYGFRFEILYKNNNHGFMAFRCLRA